MRLFSDRMKKLNEVKQTPYKYDKFDLEFINKILYCCDDALDLLVLSNYYSNYSNPKLKAWTDLFYKYIKLKGLSYNLGGIFDDIYIFEYFRENKNHLDLLDFVDIVFHEVDTETYPVDYDFIKDILDDLNTLFEENSYGYEFINGEIIRKDNKVTHENIIVPAINLLYENEFIGANDEFMKALEYYKNGDYEQAISEASKAFESTMKIICERKKYQYKKDKDTAKALVNTLITNSFIPAYMETHISGVRTALENGLPTLRNKSGGHGQGEDIRNVTMEYAEYAINLAATNIVFLVKLYNK